MYTERGLAGERKQSVGSESREMTVITTDYLFLRYVKLSKLKKRRDL
jgi:hypothetical protein